MIVYDVVLSYASEDREYVKEIADLLQKKNVKVFYDRANMSKSWGKDLYQYLYLTYKDSARFCVPFLSKSYINKKWPCFEMKSAQERELEYDTEYILPVYLENVDVPGVSKTLGALYANEYTKEDIVQFIINKLRMDSDKTDLYGELEKYINRFVHSYISIDTDEQFADFYLIKDEFKGFLLNNVFDINKDFYLSCCAMIFDVENKLITNNRNLVDDVNVLSKSKKLTSLIKIYSKSKFDDYMDLFDVCESNGLFDQSNEELGEIMKEFINILQNS